MFKRWSIEDIPSTPTTLVSCASDEYITVLSTKIANNSASATANIVLSFVFGGKEARQNIILAPGDFFDGDFVYLLDQNEKIEVQSDVADTSISLSTYISSAIYQEPPVIYTVNLSVDANISASITTQEVNEGSDVAFNFTFDNGYMLSSVSGANGHNIYIQSISHYQKRLVVEGVQENIFLSVLSDIEEYTVEVITDAHVSVSGSSTQTVSYEADATFTLSFDSGYDLQSVSAGTVSGDTLTISGVTSNMSVSVNSKEESSSDPPSADPSETYTVSFETIGYAKMLNDMDSIVYPGASLFRSFYIEELGSFEATISYNGSYATIYQWDSVNGEGYIYVPDVQQDTTVFLNVYKA